MSTKDIIKELCVRNKISVNKLETDLGFGTGYVSKLDKSTPNTAKIHKIADYFNVSVDYLITGKESEAQIDVALTNMDNIIKEYALKLADMQEDKQKLVLELIEKLN